jgi:hypothetical protein
LQSLFNRLRHHPHGSSAARITAVGTLYLLKTGKTSAEMANAIPLAASATAPLSRRLDVFLTSEF